MLLVAPVLTNAQDGETEPGIPLVGDELFGSISARHIGPALMSGRVSDIEGHPTNSRVIYIGTAGGGVWKSGDAATTFNPIFDDNCQSIGNIAVDPSDPDNTIWVGTGEVWTRNSTSVGDGIYVTRDGGANWKHMGLENSDRISSIEIHPENPDVIFVGVLGALWGDSEERGVYKTTDGGQNWEKIFYIDEGTGCADLVMDPNDPNILYASFWEFRRTAWSFSSGGDQSALYKSTDGGTTWNKIHNGFPSGQLGRIAIAVAPSNSQILYSVIESEKDEDKGLYRSDDGGANWTHLNGDFALVVRPFYFSRIVVDPTDPDVVTKAGLFGSISRDGGKTFKDLGAMHPDIHDIWFDVNNSETMYVATDGGFYRSWNGGTTMDMVSNIPVSQFYHITFDMEEPYNVYGGLQDNGSWVGPSASPGGVEGRDWEVVGVGDGFRVYPHPGNPDILYSEMQGAEQVWRFDMNTLQTQVVVPYAEEGDPDLRFNWNAPFATSYHVPDRLYIGSQYLHVSDDMGDTWRKMSPDLTTDDPDKQNQAESGGLSVDNSGAENHCTIFTIGESPLTDQIVWVGTDDGNVQVTQDAGESWTNLTGNIEGLPANTWCYHIEPSFHAEGTAYAVFDGHTSNDKNTYVYKTTDFGATWTSIVTDEIYGFARSIAEDPVNPNLLFLGTEFGLYITVDGGLHWSKFTNNMPAVAVHHLEVHPREHALVMGTHGRGVIIIDDISPLRQITEDVLNEDLVFFETGPTVLWEESSFGGTANETEFVGANPSRDVQIVYYLSKRHTFGKMTMEILDASGNVVADLAPGKQKGINIVKWSGNMKAPKTATGKTFTFGGMTSPRVEAGSYMVRITKGSQVYESMITLEYDPNSSYSLADRDQQVVTTMELYNMTEDLAYMVHQLDELTAFIAKDGLDDKKSGKIKDKALDAISDLKGDLVITTGDNYVGQAENELREDIADLYSTVASYYGRPSAAQLSALEVLKGDFADAEQRFKELWSGEVQDYLDHIAQFELNFEVQAKEEFLEK